MEVYMEKYKWHGVDRANGILNKYGFDLVLVDDCYEMVEIDCCPSNNLSKYSVAINVFWREIDNLLKPKFYIVCGNKVIQNTDEYNQYRWTLKMAALIMIDLHNIEFFGVKDN